ncbi:tellurite resistance TerB C-terminal domain-containing protein [Bacteroides sp. 51]|uniref:tellurite resistance TerB C-terminal domain-containing protein n=1 Tax=Bacteroides sp. 51 TaxID=2302938 RepID=UPI0013D32F18|nr:tellurite resistance TerB C-terminal domain-containing protein [Bacteroides sp. 51]
MEKLLPYVSNRFCKQRTLILYFTIQRKYHREDDRSKDAILQLCKIAIFQKLNYDSLGQDEFYGNYIQLLNNPELCQAISTESHKLIASVSWVDESLYNACTDAWEIYYSRLREAFKPENVQSYYDEVCWLADRNSSVMTKRKLYLDSYQFLVETDREYSLRFYLHYLNVSTEIKYRKISAKNSKKLFRRQGEKERFDAICTDLLRFKDISKVLDQFDQLQISQRKKISLNIEAIKTAAEKQSKVAGVLSEWLADEEEVPETDRIPQKNIEENSRMRSQENPKDVLFQLFIDNSYRINKEEVDIFARSHGLFTSQFVEGINDEHFEELDDVLIEEDEEYYILNEVYCQQIKEHED